MDGKNQKYHIRRWSMIMSQSPCGLAQTAAQGHFLTQNSLVRDANSASIERPCQEPV